MQIIVILSSIVSCAGPMNPFGAVERYPWEASRPPKLVGMGDNKKVKNDSFHISFSPSKQVWHDATKLIITIYDKKGIPADFQWSLLYGVNDITEQIHKLARFDFIDQSTLNIVIPNLRLLPDRENNIAVVYRRNLLTDPIVTRYTEPNCKIFFKLDKKKRSYVRRPIHLKSKWPILDMVEKVSVEKNINPGLMAALVAQESNFNPHAVSWARAIGLTQITSLAEKHVVLEHKEWPQYAGISRFGVVRLKALIYLGRINSQNEWRLDVEKSIRGGIEYINVLKDYWAQDYNLAKLKSIYPDNHSEVYEDIILASYNSGPYRVKNALEKHKKNWLEANSLENAKKYVGKIKSYCYHAFQ